MIKDIMKGNKVNFTILVILILIALIFSINQKRKLINFFTNVDIKNNTYADVSLNDSKEILLYKNFGHIIIGAEDKITLEENKELWLYYSDEYRSLFLITFFNHKVSELYCSSLEESYFSNQICHLAVNTGKLIEDYSNNNYVSFPEEFDLYTGLHESKVLHSLGKPYKTKIILQVFKYDYYPERNLTLGYKSGKLFSILVSDKFIGFEKLEKRKSIFDIYFKEIRPAIEAN